MNSSAESISYNPIQVAHQVGLHHIATNTSSHQLSIRQAGSFRRPLNSFGAIGSGRRGEPDRIPLNLGGPATPGQRGTHGTQSAGIMPGSALAHTLAPYNGNGSSQTSGSLRTADHQLVTNATGMIDQLFSPTLAGSNSGNHRRTFTPTEEELKLSLQKLGMAPNNAMSGDILDLAQRNLEISVTRQASLEKKWSGDVFSGVSSFGAVDRAVDQLSISDSSSNGTEFSGEPRTPATANPGFHEPSITDFSFNTLTNNHTQNNREIGASLQPGYTAIDSFKSAGQIDPYIPEMSSDVFSTNGPDSRYFPRRSVKTDIRTGNFTTDYGDINGVSAVNNRAPDVQSVDTPSLRGVSRVESYADSLFASPRSSSNRLSPLNPEHSGSDYNLSSQNELLKREVQTLKRQLHDYKHRFDYASTLAMRHITIREAEIASLKRQIRQEGLRPYNEPAVMDDSFYEKELGMLFRMLCCWGKRFYKFPTGESISRHLQTRVSQICEDQHSEQFLMANSTTKYLVIVSLATRWIVDEILNPIFLDKVANALLSIELGVRAGESLREVIETAKENSEYDDQLFEAIQRAAGQRASVLLDAIHPLMSRPKDKSHHEQTCRQFTQVAQHAARIILSTAKKDATFYFSFPRLGEAFVADAMKEVTGDTLGLDVASKATTPIWHELRGELVRLCMLPLVTVCIKEQGGSYRQFDAYKANVLLC